MLDRSDHQVYICRPVDCSLSEQNTPQSDVSLYLTCFCFLSPAVLKVVSAVLLFGNLTFKSERNNDQAILPETTGMSFIYWITATGGQRSQSCLGLLVGFKECTPSEPVLRSLSCFQGCASLLNVKGTGHYLYLLKIIVSIKTYLVTSNGELFVV